MVVTCIILSIKSNSGGEFIQKSIFNSKQILNLFFVCFKNSIDATSENGKLGRLVNHSRNGNLITKTVTYKNRPHLVLIAKDNIKEGEELTYDYGDRTRESLINHPWLAL